MIDDETQKDQPSEDTPVEGSDAEAAGPVAAGDPPPPPVAEASSGAVPPATPPAGEESEPQEEAPQAEGEAVEESEAEKAEKPEEKAQKPKPKADEKGEKKEVIPGADLEPIAVEPEERPLSAEEQARLEAEEEERARREAELVGEAEEEPRAASRAPAKLEGDARYLATGKRKTSIARVTLLPGSGKIEVNGRTLNDYFTAERDRKSIFGPLEVTNTGGKMDIFVNATGGGPSGQAGAIIMGLGRALARYDQTLEQALRNAGFLTRDSR
ncbi:MAG TPA: 30S ribosomal protein S9, partial [Solirubrobacterales bacterium]|nr:30S ribosomal protein S9 [Solirubrobacterales bacterium]